MPKQDIFSMKFPRVYPLLVQKAVRKGRTREEVDALVTWQTGYTAGDIAAYLDSEENYGSFFAAAPAPNPLRFLVKGSVCGVKVQEIDDPLLREIRILDKLVDDLARGKSTGKILPTK